MKSPNLNKEYTRHGAAHIRGLPIRVVYSGVWRYLQENTEGSPLSLTINIVKSPSWLSAENSCKIRHYENRLCNLDWYVWIGGYAFVNMIFLPSADPAIGLICGAIIFIVGFIIGLFDYSRVLRKKAEKEKRQAEQDSNNELMRQYLEKKLKEDAKNEDSQ